MSVAIPHNYVPVLALRDVLSNDISLAAMTVAGRPLQKNSEGEVYYLIIDQEDESGGPWIVVGPPILHDKSERKSPNGPNLIAADFLIDVWVRVKDVEPDDLNLNRMLAWVVKLLEGGRIAVSGGEAFTITVYGYPTPQRPNRNGPVNTGLGVTFLVAVQTD